MSLNNLISPEAAQSVSDLGEPVIGLVLRIAALGLDANKIHAGCSAVARGEEVRLPDGLGRAKPLTINAWSFVNDEQQFLHTYGMSHAEAGELRAALRADQAAAVRRIAELVGEKLRQRGSPRPVSVSTTGMPGAPSGPGAPPSSDPNAAALKAEIRGNSGVYGMYSFEAEDTGYPGGLHFRVPLGAGLFAVHQNKRGAVDVARVCRVKGRFDDLVSGNVVFWPDGGKPLFAGDIPAGCTFTGVLPPGSKPPRPPPKKEKTVVGSPQSPPAPGPSKAPAEAKTEAA